MSEENTLGDGMPMSSDGSRYVIVIEKGRISRSQGWIKRTVLACVPGNGFETGEVNRWSMSQSGVVITKEIF